MSLPTYIAKTNEFIKKLENIKDAPYSDVDISSGVTLSRQLGLSYENGDVSVFVSYCNLEGKNYLRHLYQVKMQSSGKVKNIDSVMSVITQFEDEYIYADKITVTPDSGCIYVDIYKTKKE